MNNFDEFRFTPAMLSGQRKPGISAYMRIKNEEQFVRLAILSHIDYYDEIIACYNNCTDNTEQILHDLAKQHPNKLKVYHYLPKVHPLITKEHAQTPDDSVHGLANYSNYALSKTTYKVAVKLDADHLAIPCKLKPVLDTIRRDMAADREKIYMFSGINLMRGDDDKIGVAGHWPFSGNGDIYYHPVNNNSYFKNGKNYEKFSINGKKLLKREYIGVLYFHLKYLKKDLGYAAYTEEVKRHFIEHAIKHRDIVPFDEFKSSRYHKEMKKCLGIRDRLYCTLYASKTLQHAKYKFSGKPPKIRQIRLAQLAGDLQGIDFNRDALDRLEA